MAKISVHHFKIKCANISVVCRVFGKQPSAKSGDILCLFVSPGYPQNTWISALENILVLAPGDKVDACPTKEYKLFKKIRSKLESSKI